MSAPTTPAGAPSVTRAVPPQHLDAVEIARLLGQHEPTPEQRAVVEAGLAPLLVVAGAGSGKTETMAARVVHLVANGVVEPDRVLGLTFTRKAAGELAERVRLRLRGLRAALAPRGVVVPDGEPVVATYHSYAAAVLSEHGLRVGVEPGARLLGEASAWQLASEVVESWTGELPGVDKAVSTVVAGVLALAGESAEHLVDPEQLDEALGELLAAVRALPKDESGGAPAAPSKSSTLGRALAALQGRRAMVPLLQAYTRRKAEAECLDFGDQVRLAARAAATSPVVGAAERSRFDVVLLDEYQDTSHAQLELLRHLFGGGHPVTAVGDPHQSIYGFRGASAGTLERFPRQFPRADGAPAAVAHLATSWRNDEQVLAVANTASAPLRDDAGEAARGGAVVVPPLRARPGAGTGDVRVAWYATALEEASAVADQVASLWGLPDQQPSQAATHPPGPAGAPRVPPPTTAVLCRRRAQIVPLEQALRARGLPVEVVGMGGLLDRPEVVDVLAVLRVLHDPARGDALARLLTGPRWRIGPRDLHALGRWARALHRQQGPEPLTDAPPSPPDPSDVGGLVEALASLPPVRAGGPVPAGFSRAGLERLAALAAELAELRGRTDQSLPDLVQDVVRTTRLDIELASVPGVAPQSARSQLDAFTEVAASFAEGAPRASLGAFLAWVDTAAARERGLDQGEEDVVVAEVDDVVPSRTAVQLLTVHAAKGLEWDVVAVPGLCEGSFPSRQSGPQDGVDVGSGWLTGLGGLPYDLRGDAPSLPAWGWRTARHLAELSSCTDDFRRECGAHEVAEERRLAYVAVTRARSVLLLSGSSWTPGRSTPTRASRFLREAATGLEVPDAVREAVEAVPEGPNPLAEHRASAPWPVPEPPSAQARRAAAEQVRAAGRQAAGGQGGPVRTTPWSAEVDRLLAERERLRSPVRQVELPAHLSASRLVQLARDPAALALAVRRPVPSRPQHAARRGTAFHAWLESRWGAAALVDLDDLPGAQDEGLAEEEDLPALQEAFEASEWASRVPLAVEVAVETPVDGTVLRGRIDAVFRTPDGGYEVVDWKTGRPPSAADADAAAVQLAVYRLAWSRLQQVPLERVSAAFFYAAAGRTVRPVAGLDEEGLVAVLRRAGAVASS